MNTIKLLFTAFLIIAFVGVNAQEEKKYKIHTVAFYNLENLFDAVDDTSKNDEASPIMEIKSDREGVYKKKVRNMAKVISDIGLSDTGNSPAVIGICEVENRTVIEDLANAPELLNKDYGIVHFDSPDRRGIDVALMYQKDLFQLISKSAHTLKIFDNASRKRIYTRDQLLVTGKLDGETMHFIVNHWPSRRGGEERSRAKRVAAAKLSKHIIDSLQVIDPYAKIIIMGDLNDNPNNASIKDVLKAERKKKQVALKGIYNPMITLFKKGQGSNAYRDSWSLFDQMMLTKPFIEEGYQSFKFYKAGIFNKNYLINTTGRYKGYPFRSFGNGSFTEGYSDHFPVYVYLIKEVE
ncbi:endonuclease/exonuclease/phosphatase family protein [Bizionia gelidisalsuginis]|uniref:Endonuclease/exonuclease/phosphatase family protein n=1 Tax=Bizionia gelidisalsuginis TaxID=291188 RepID=A0ABY3MB46_9FLAO|nr:endonuclease/exonuclease/phosphatase family protein [Bizionia gelidisalsuginis]TYC13523.1 endonuclease/exonuclease/phosphatase family protein [Bizionia gelidisalsuginis]